ncbi:hypothetical protein SFRURICE_005599 [Spodoptera frugiperda]|nr:hypothetical protein SFRURICE_005599 [Spodoptera frugiperda]
MSSGIAVWCMGLVCVGVMWLISHVYHLLIDVYEQSAALSDIEYSWFFKLLLNLVGYSTVLLPMFIMYKYLEKINYFDKISNAGRTWRVLFTCFGEPGERLPDAAKVRKDESPTREGAQLAFCFIGLMSSYLVWGLLQEKIMTQVYVMSDGSTLRFSDSQFLVFVNRLGGAGGGGRAPGVYPRRAGARAALQVLLLLAHQRRQRLVPVRGTQVLSKSCKVIPVMLMGKLVSRNKYEVYEYVTAVLISVGMIMFMFGSHDTNMVSSAMTWAARTLLGGGCLKPWCRDAFSGRVQRRFRSATSCGAPHCCRRQRFSVRAHRRRARAHTRRRMQLLQHPCPATASLLSLSSAIGQLLIYHTIARFGAVVFTIIMTLRQAVSILLSCVVYGHRVSAGGALGVVVVLGAVLLRLYARARMRTRRRAAHL